MYQIRLQTDQSQTDLLQHSYMVSSVISNFHSGDSIPASYSSQAPLTPTHRFSVF
jgi:hypothetical protein